MNIDEMKLKWQHSELFEKAVEEVVTKKILENEKNKIGTRLDEMKKKGRKETYSGLVFVIITLPVLIIFFKDVFSLYFLIAFGVLAVSSSLYSLYMQTNLNKVDFATMNVEMTSVSLLRYRKQMILFTVIGGLVTLVIVCVLLVGYLKQQRIVFDGLKFLFMIAFPLIFSRYYLWKNYVKKVGDIQRDLKELKAFAQLN